MNSDLLIKLHRTSIVNPEKLIYASHFGYVVGFSFLFLPVVPVERPSLLPCPCRGFGKGREGKAQERRSGRRGENPLLRGLRGRRASFPSPAGGRGKAGRRRRTGRKGGGEGK